MTVSLINFRFPPSLSLLADSGEWCQPAAPSLLPLAGECPELPPPPPAPPPAVTPGPRVWAPLPATVRTTGPPGGRAGWRTPGSPPATTPTSPSGPGPPAQTGWTRPASSWGSRRPTWGTATTSPCWSNPAERLGVRLGLTVSCQWRWWQ